MRQNVDDLYTHLENTDAIVSTASGCGVTVKDYGRLLQHDPVYAQRAEAVSAHVQDVSEFVLTQSKTWQPSQLGGQKVAWHAPCTLQHGQGLNGIVEEILQQVGYELVDVDDAHLCCGSAGTYAVLQPTLAEQLRKNKQRALLVGQPDIIATANVGCQTHLQHNSSVPVVHWIELLK